MKSFCVPANIICFQLNRKKHIGNIDNLWHNNVKRKNIFLGNVSFNSVITLTLKILILFWPIYVYHFKSFYGKLAYEELGWYINLHAFKRNIPFKFLIFFFRITWWKTFGHCKEYHFKRKQYRIQIYPKNTKKCKRNIPAILFLFYFKVSS